MERHKKIKSYLKENNIPFEKKHDKDFAKFEVFEKDGLKLVYTAYYPYNKKDNPKSIMGMMELSIQYKTKYCYFTLFDENDEVLLNPVATIPLSDITKPIILDKNNLILLQKEFNDAFKSNYYHYTRVKDRFYATTYFENISYNEHLIDNNLILVDFKKLYNFKNETLIDLPFGNLLMNQADLNRLLKKWNVNDNDELFTLLNNKLINNNLFCVYKRIGCNEEDFSFYFDVMAFINVNGRIVSDLFYRSHNKFESIIVTNESVNSTLDNLQEYCEIKLHQMIQSAKLEDLSDEIIKKLELK